MGKESEKSQNFRGKERKIPFPDSFPKSGPETNWERHFGEINHFPILTLAW